MDYFVKKNLALEKMELPLSIITDAKQHLQLPCGLCLDKLIICPWGNDIYPRIPNSWCIWNVFPLALQKDIIWTGLKAFYISQTQKGKCEYTHTYEPFQPGMEVFYPINKGEKTN